MKWNVRRAFVVALAVACVVTAFNETPARAQEKKTFTLKG